MTVALGSTDYVKGAPLKAKNVGKLKPLRTGRKKEKIKKKNLTVLRQAHFLPSAELGHEGFRLIGSSGIGQAL